MADLTPKDYFGNELYIGDTVVFSPDNSTDLIEGAIKEIEYKENGTYLTIVSEKSYANIFVWERNFNRVIKKFELKQEQKSTNESLDNTNQEFKVLRIVTKYENCYDFNNVTCALEKLWDKETIMLRRTEDNSFVGRWFLEDICGYFYV